MIPEMAADGSQLAAKDFKIPERVKVKETVCKESVSSVY